MYLVSQNLRHLVSIFSRYGAAMNDATLEYSSDSHPHTELRAIGVVGFYR